MKITDNNNLLTDLTIVIPTYNRAQEIKKNITYWRKYSSNILVIDGSDKPLDDSFVDDLPKNIVYCYLKESYVSRLRVARNMVRSKYVALLADDERFLPSGLISCIKELMINPDLVSCIGRPVGFSRGRDEKINAYLAYPEFEGYSIDDEDPFERVLNHLQNYAPSTIYSVMRAEVWLKALQAYTTKEYHVGAVGEIQFGTSSAYLGKSKVIPVLGWLRCGDDRVDSDIKVDPSLNINRVFHNWWSDERNNLEKSLFIKDTAITLSQFYGGDLEMLNKFLDKVFSSYSILAKKKERQSNHQKVKDFFRNTLIQSCPAFILDRLKYYRDSKKNRLLDVGRLLCEQGVEVNFEELNIAEASL